MVHILVGVISQEGLIRTAINCCLYLTGFIWCFLIFESLKLIISEARPNFWAICAPNIAPSDHMVVTYLDCSNPLNVTKIELMETMKSFPSGHAMWSIYAAVSSIILYFRHLNN